MKPNVPLDMEEAPKPVSQFRDYLVALEILPPLLIAIGVLMKHLEWTYWMEILALGGALAVILYFFLSWYLFKVDQYRWLELILSVLSGVVFTTGIVGLLFLLLYWDGAIDLLQFALNAIWPLSILSIVLLLFNLRDERASRFYRRLVARLMIFAVIILTLMLGIL